MCCSLQQCVQIAVRGSVLQFAAVYASCSMWQCLVVRRDITDSFFVVCSSTWQCVAVCSYAFKLQYVAVCCSSVLQFTAVHASCSTWQSVVVRDEAATYIEVCCGVLRCVAVCFSVLQYVAVCCSVLQCVAVCFSVLQCVAVCFSVLQCVATS